MSSDRQRPPRLRPIAPGTIATDDADTVTALRELASLEAFDGSAAAASQAPRSTGVTAQTCGLPKPNAPRESSTTMSAR